MQNNISISPLELRKESFRRGFFDFITKRNGKHHIKQEMALRILTDDETEEFMYGGGAGGAKSWTGCAWLAFMCMLYPDTNWFIGRKELKRITESTLRTFFKVSKEYGFQDQFKFNAQKNFILFNNGSKIDLLELKYLPSDPMYERFGSTEYTGGWIEEAPECNFGSFDILNTRVGRHLNDLYNLKGKLFLTANPNKNWSKREFYDKHTKGDLGGIRKFLQSLAIENPFAESGYIDRLKRTKDESKKQRLLHGNWEYDDDPNALCSYKNITAIFHNDHVKEGNYYLTCDVARLGSDKARIAVWCGWIVVHTESYDISKTTLIQERINKNRFDYGIPKHNCIADEDGVGGGVVDNCGILGFTNNATPIPVQISDSYEKPNYSNLQTQCGYYLVDRINKNEIWVEANVTPQEREEIEQELAQLKSYKTEDDRKVYLLPKKIIYENIGRSPDWRDLFLMRSFFDLSQNASDIVVKIYND